MILFKKIPFIVILSVVLIISCNRDSYLISPNAPTSKEVSVDYFFDYIQVQFVEFAQEVSVFGRQLTRMTSYNNNNYSAAGIRPADVDDAWREAYKDFLVNSQIVLDKSSQLNYPNYQAITYILQSYVLMTLVDFFGDVPYSKALSTSNLNPPVDNERAVYDSALAKLNLALDLFDGASKYPSTDLYYSGTTKGKIAKWKKVANSLKLRYYLYLSNVDATVATSGINSVLSSSNGLISSSSDDFQFYYSTNVSSPDSRHPTYSNSYAASGAGSDIDQSAIYIGTYAAYLLTGESNSDPRWRYLIYRQASGLSALIQDYSCKGAPRPSHFSASDPYCQVTSFWTRDHGNVTGIPPDGFQRTIFGVYPVGGAFDKDALLPSNESAVSTLKGAGIFPFITSSMVNFYRAEAAIVLSTSDKGNEAKLLESGMDNFSSKITSFGISVADVSVYKSGYKVEFNTFKSTILANFNSATTNEDKLNILLKEAYKASWGNGIEPYNNYRRTGMPNNFSPMSSLSTDKFPGTLPYPLAAFRYNKSIVAKDLSNLPNVFWASKTATLK